MPNTTTPNQTSLINVAFLVAGTCIGGGMLALPVTCGQTGFIPSFFAMALIWAMATFTALCLVEVCMWTAKKDVHFITLASTYLGPIGKWASWVLFLFISYASLVAYVTGSGHIIAQVVTSLGWNCPKALGCALFALFFSPFIFLPHTKLAQANTLLFYAMIGAYLFIVIPVVPLVEMANISHSNWSFLYQPIPMLLVAFSFQTIVPSLPPLLGYNKKKLRLACCLGTSLAFVAYVVWQFIILGAVPLEGEYGLLSAYTHGEPASYSLSKIIPSPLLSGAIVGFAFLALITSFLGIGMGLFDFLADGLHIQKTPPGRTLLTILVLVPSLLFSVFFERAFITALDISGGFGDTLLNGLIPLAMVGVGASRIACARARKLLLYSVLVLVGVLFALALGCELYSRTAHI